MEVGTLRNLDATLPHNSNDEAAYDVADLPRRWAPVRGPSISRDPLPSSVVWTRPRSSPSARERNARGSEGLPFRAVASATPSLLLGLGDEDRRAVLAATTRHRYS